MSDFTVIPVLDLQGNSVVHARGGKRADYRPIETDLGPAGDPLEIARALLNLTESPVLYVADLDAIEGVGNHFELCRELADALPQTSLWIDAGFSDVTDCAFWLPLGATLVIGSESLDTLDAWEDLHGTFGNSLVLSLDVAGEDLRGPQALLAEPSLWPARVLALNLSRVGTATGPDLELLKTLLALNESCAVYAGGGVRSVEDLDAVAAAGAQGALAATALHSGALSQNEIAAFLRRRRSES